MFVTLVERALPVRVLGSVTLAAGLVLAAGLAGAATPVTAVALAAGIASALPGAALIALGWAVRVTFRGLNACRCVGMLGLGVLAGGLTAAVLPLVGAADRSRVVAVGLTATATLTMLGLLQLPGVATSWFARLRLALDGLAIGTLVALVGWLLLPVMGYHHRLGYVAATVAVAGTAITVAAVARTAATNQRPAFVRCGLGVALAIVGLALLVELVSPGHPPWAMFAATALVVAGPPVIWAGARRVEFAPAETAGGGSAVSLDETFGGYPMLALPVAAGVLATAYHLLVRGLPDHTAVCLSMASGAALVGREILVAVDLRRRARRLAEQGARLRALVAGAGDVTMVLGEDLVVSWQSPAARQLGLADSDVVGRRFTDLVHPDDTAAVADQLRAVVAGAVALPVLLSARLMDGTGGWRETESTLSDLREVPDVGALVVQVRDVGQRRHLERTVHLLASTDQRTGLPNRRELLRAVAARRAGGRRRGAVVVIGLHGLTGVNELRGRAAGDAVLVEAGRRLRAHVGTDDMAARVGESQLAVVTLAGPIEAYALGVQLVHALTMPYELPDRPVQLQVSVGLAPLWVGDRGEEEEVLRRGELALRRASRLGRNQVEWYDESLEEQLVRRLDLERHLPGAAGRGELDLVYQPVVELDRRRPVGVEALLRWRHPVLGRVLPSELIPVADQIQVSGEIAEWVLNTACWQVAGWRETGHDLWLAVNVSARQLTDAEFVPGVAAALSVHQSPPERLTIEISASEVGGDLPGVASQLGRLRGLGVRTALDDVGAGHADLAWLRRLPLDVVKLAIPPAPESAAPATAAPATAAPATAAENAAPAAAASGNAASGNAGRLVAAVVELGERLGLTVVAEGLEAEPQRELVRQAGCRLGQGYLVSPPAPAERFEAYLELARGVEKRSAGSSSL